MQSNEIIGYRVQDHNNMFVAFDGRGNYRTYGAPEPISHADAYRRLAAFIEENPGVPVPQVIPVYREYTPIETTSKELSTRLKSLCSAHGLRLGMSDEQIEARIAKELQEFGVSSIVDHINVLSR